MSNLFTAQGVALEMTKVQTLMFCYHIDLETLSDVAKADKVEWAIKRKQVMAARSQRAKEAAEQSSRATK